LILQRFEFTTIEEALELRKTGELVQRKAGKIKRVIDKAYVKSFVPPMSVYFVYLLISALIAPRVGLLILLPPVIMLTIWYWPWGLFFRLIVAVKSDD